MGFADHSSTGVGSKDGAGENSTVRLDTQVAVRPRVYSDRLPKNVQQDESEMIGPIFIVGGQNAKCFNIERELHHKITRSEYFKRLYVFKTFKKVVDVIYEKVTNVAPWIQRGQQKRGFWKTPSSAFCLLLKLFHLKLTEAQVRELLDHPDSPYIRAIGMLYVRYGAPCATLWKWLGPYCDDLEEFAPGTQPTETCSLGKLRSQANVMVCELCNKDDVLCRRICPTIADKPRAFLRDGVAPHHAHRARASYAAPRGDSHRDDVARKAQ